MAAWAELHGDIIALILKKITDIEDFITFEFVCRWWRQVARNKRYFPQIPRLVRGENEDNIGYRRIYNVVSGETKNLYAPELSGRTNCIGLKHGWILTISLEGEMNLVNPLFRFQIELPRLTSTEDNYFDGTSPSYLFMVYAALSANPSETSDFAVMIAPDRGNMYLSYWRPWDKSWTVLKDQEHERSWYNDLIYYRDQFYAVAVDGTIWACKVPRDDSIPARTLVTTIDSELTGLAWSYIVESGGALLVLADRWEEKREEDVVEEEPMVKFRNIFCVYELDMMNGCYKQISSLGNRAIFVGRNTSISFDTSEYPDSIKPNHIYFTHYFKRRVEGVWMGKGHGNDMFSYNLEDGTYTCICIKEANSYVSPNEGPFWLMPSF